VSSISSNLLITKKTKNQTNKSKPAKIAYELSKYFKTKNIATGVINFQA